MSPLDCYTSSYTTPARLQCAIPGPTSLSWACYTDRACPLPLVSSSSYGRRFEHCRHRCTSTVYQVAFPPDSPTLTVLLCIGIRKRQLDMSQLDMSQLVTVLVSMSAGSGQTIPRHSMMHQVNGIIMSLPAEVADFRDAPSMDEYLQYTANERVNDSEAEY